MKILRSSSYHLALLLTSHLSHVHVHALRLHSTHAPRFIHHSRRFTIPFTPDSLSTPIPTPTISMISIRISGMRCSNAWYQQNLNNQHTSTSPSTSTFTPSIYSCLDSPSPFTPDSPSTATATPTIDMSSISTSRMHEYECIVLILQLQTTNVRLHLRLRDGNFRDAVSVAVLVAVAVVYTPNPNIPR